MKILLTSIGTRGDIEPFLAVGAILQSNGHEIIYSFPAQFSSLIPAKGNFHPLSPRVIQLIESKEGQTVMGKAGWWKKAKALSYLYKEGQKINEELITTHYETVKAENPDIIIHNAKCSYPTLWGLAQNKPTILLSPVPFFIHYVKGHPHIGFNKNFGSWINKLTYRLSNFGLTKTIYDGQKFLPERFNYSKSIIKTELLTKKIIFSIAPALFSRPDYWPKNAQVLGFNEREKPTTWKPDKSLEQFLTIHSKVLFLTFGSMVNSNPEQTSRCIYQALAELNIPTIVNTASGGLLKLQEFSRNKNFHFVENIPYQWIFKRVYAIIHHGGSGTTHSALKHGCASLIIPHIIDQFGWSSLVQELNLGPKGISINKISTDHLKKPIEALWSNEAYKENARKLASSMSNENMEETLLAFILER